MKTLQATKQFKKDIKKLRKQGKDFSKPKDILDIICEGKELEIKYRDHKLVGSFQKARECHVESDWLVIYEIHLSIIKLRRTDFHSELFKMLELQILNLAP